MRLTIDARMVRSSGIGVYLQNLLVNPLLQKYQIKLLCLEKDIEYLQSLNVNAFQFVIFEKKIYSLEELLTAPFKTFNTELFWSPHYNVPLVNFSAKKIVTVHDVFHLAFYNSLNFKQKVYSKLMIDRAVNYSNLIFTVSNFSKTEIIKYSSCDPDKIKVVYNGVDHKRFSKKYLEIEKQEILDRYLLNGPYFLFVGNVKPHKNLKKALLGFKEFIYSAGNQYCHFKFLIVGKRDGFITGDNEINVMLQESFYKGKVNFTGWVQDEDLALLYQQASVFIFPSIYEGFGFPPLEAMAAGCPVISSNAACLTEVYEDAALYFNPCDPVAIGEALWKVTDDSRLKENLIKKGLEQSKKYKWEDAIRQKLVHIEEYLK